MHTRHCHVLMSFDWFSARDTWCWFSNVKASNQMLSSHFQGILISLWNKSWMEWTRWTSMFTQRCLFSFSSLRRQHHSIQNQYSFAVIAIANMKMGGYFWFGGSMQTKKKLGFFLFQKENFVLGVKSLCMDAMKVRISECCYSTNTISAWMKHLARKI